MFRTTIRADESTDVATVVSDISRQASQSGVPPEKTSQLTQSLEFMLRDLIERGSQMASIGSKMSASRTFSDECYEVVLQFGAGQRRTFWARLLSGITGR